MQQFTALMKQLLFLMTVFCLVSMYFAYISSRTVNMHLEYSLAPVQNNFLMEKTHSLGIPIKKLRLCDETLSIQYGQGNWHCPEDQTCVNCQQRSIDRHDGMLTEFEKHVEERRLEYSKYDKNKPIILVSLNSGYEKLFRNFLCSVEANYLNNVLNNLYVLPCEKTAVDMLEELGVKHSNANGWMDNFKIDPKFKGTNIGHHYLINGLTFVVMNEMVQAGFSVLMMDADMIFRKSPIPYLNALMNQPEYSRLDFVCQHTGRSYDDRSPCNTGLVFFRPTERTKTLTQTLRDTIGIRPARSDQL